MGAERVGIGGCLRHKKSPGSAGKPLKCRASNPFAPMPWRWMPAPQRTPYAAFQTEYRGMRWSIFLASGSATRNTRHGLRRWALQHRVVVFSSELRLGALTVWLLAWARGLNWVNSTQYASALWYGRFASENWRTCSAPRTGNLCQVLPCAASQSCRIGATVPTRLSAIARAQTA